MLSADRVSVLEFVQLICFGVNCFQGTCTPVGTRGWTSFCSVSLLVMRDGILVVKSPLLWRALFTDSLVCVDFRVLC